MKNWIIILLIFVLPLGLYAYLDANAQSNKICKVMGSEQVKNPKAKIIKFYSPMCSECKDASVELEKAMTNYNDTVLVEEINVVDNDKTNAKYNKSAIKKFDVTLVPTIVILDKEGNIIKKNEGLMKSDEIIEVLAKVK